MTLMNLNMNLEYEWTMTWMNMTSNLKGIMTWKWIETWNEWTWTCMTKIWMDLNMYEFNYLENGLNMTSNGMELDMNRLWPRLWLEQNQARDPQLK